MSSGVVERRFMHSHAEMLQQFFTLEFPGWESRASPRDRETRHQESAANGQGAPCPLGHGEQRVANVTLCGEGQGEQPSFSEKAPCSTPHMDNLGTGWLTLYMAKVLIQPCADFCRRIPQH